MATIMPEPTLTPESRLDDEMPIGESPDQELMELKTFRLTILSVAWSPDGTMLAVGGDQLQIFAVPETDTDIRYVNMTQVNEADISGWSRVDYGLPGGQASGLRQIIIAPDGTIWVGTRKGISILDGEEWLNYTAANSGLPGSSYVQMIQKPSSILNLTAKGLPELVQLMVVYPNSHGYLDKWHCRG